MSSRLLLSALLVLIAIGGACAWLPSAAAAEETPAVREALVRALTTEGEEQLKEVGALADTGSDLVTRVLTSWPRDEVYIYQVEDGKKIPVLLDDTQDADGKAKAIRIDNGKPLTDAKGAELTFLPADLTAADTDNKLRLAIKKTLDVLALSAPDPDARRSAVLKLGMSQKPEYLGTLMARLEKEKSPQVRKALHEAVAIIQLKDASSTVAVNAAHALVDLHSIGSLGVLKDMSADPGMKSRPEVLRAIQAAAKSIDGYVSTVNFFGTIFRGFSLGSILLVAALGLAITFGVMGVINMAHGEIIAVGAYATYVTHNLFTTWFGAAGREWYFVAAVPLAFLSAAAVGMVLEWSVIRFLYRRPLESLLATWGVSLVLQQCFRLLFGSNNVQVYSPSWLSGNFTINDVVLGYNRLFVIGFAVLIVFCTYLLLTRTPLGLLIRAVTQKREMAACLGVRTERVNLLTFAFGSGLAGLAGAFLSQLGNVGPSLGQSYIVDCFMTVVVGGVGNLIGTVCSALGIGVIDQTLQPFIGPVMGKITVLAGIILFLQWRPAGLFVTRSRSLEG